MKFVVGRSTQGAFSKEPPCPTAFRGPESEAWPGEYTWYVELADLDALLAFMETNGGAIGLFSADDGDEPPAIEIFDDDDD